VTLKPLNIFPGHFVKITRPPLGPDLVGIALTGLSPLSQNEHVTKRPIWIMTLLLDGVPKDVLVYHDDVVEIL